MPSKGIICYAYIAVPGVEIEFQVPKNSITKRDQNQFTVDHLEVESRNLGHFKFTGQFKFIVRRNGNELSSQWVDVNSMTGSLENGTMKDMDQTPSTFVDDLIIAYGFYDAGPGHAGLPKQHQCYVTVTRDYSNWMRDVVPLGSEKANKPFKRMVLPAAHDIGMNSMHTSQQLLSHAGTGLIKEVLGHSLPGALAVFNKVGDAAINHIAPDIIRALALTQKDSLAAILKLGARYFEFRPAKCHRQLQRVSPLPDTWYFQHGAIPGMPYAQFLADIVAFLAAQRDELVVVQLRWDGVPGECPRPSDADLAAVVDAVLRDSGAGVGSDIRVGSLDDMLSKSIQQLRAENKRLLLLRDVAQVSNYDDVANATLTGDSMVAKLHAMSNEPPRGGHAITLLQCQATATNIRDVIIASVLDADVSTSPILATKGVCDGKILPLVGGEVGRRLVGGEGVGVVVLMNDFFDGGTADVGVRMCGERLK
ncbi:PLC-like phosphodiesterase [Massariosphaeria phaeospora]|uniref:PLC-like phosphodiesterase n=1 Tax=Massariosphaeria phaeospora TaxID=100035 RepID=A0A7C8MG28_9PLEO|nr:PLC-like phosphodiesterase [Massariosphaeria phaeospora]